MKRNKRNEVILFCVAALICGAVIAICISVSMKNNSSESGSSTGEASQTLRDDKRYDFLSDRTGNHGTGTYSDAAG